MLTNMEKVMLIEEIENRLNINLERHQLEYIFNKNKKVLFTSPRRYGKNMMAAVRAIVNSLATSNRRTIIIAHGDIAVRQALELLAYVAGPFISKKIVYYPCRIILKNGSEIYILNGKTMEQMRGCRVDEIIIQEAFMYNSSTLDIIINRSFALLMHNDNYNISLIGTPTPVSSSALHNLATSSTWHTTIIRASETSSENLL